MEDKTEDETTEDEETGDEEMEDKTEDEKTKRWNPDRVVFPLPGRTIGTELTQFFVKVSKKKETKAKAVDNKSTDAAGSQKVEARQSQGQISVKGKSAKKFGKLIKANRTYQAYSSRPRCLGAESKVDLRLESIAIDAVQRHDLSEGYLSYADAALMELYRQTTDSAPDPGVSLPKRGRPRKTLQPGESLRGIFQQPTDVEAITNMAEHLKIKPEEKSQGAQE